LVWLDLDRYRYFSDEENKYVAGSLRIRAFHSPSGLAERYLDAEERLDGVERLRDYVAEARIRHNLHNPLRLRVTCINLVEYMRPALLKGGSTPYIQLLWNGFEVGCTNALPAESRLGTSWFDETFHMLVPYNRLIEDCTLELVAWDSCGKDRRRSALGASKAEAERLRINEEESFLGCRVIHGLELRTLVDSASLFSDSDSEDNDDMSGSQAMVKSVIKWFDLCKSWAVDASRQEPGQIKGRIKVELELIEGDADKKDDDSDDEDDEESDEEQEGSGDDDDREGSESAASSARLSPAARTTKGLVLSPGAADMQSLGSLGSEGRSLRSRRSSKSGRSTRSGRSRQSKDSSPSRRSAVDSRTGKRLDLLASLKLSPAFDLTSLERAYDETGEADEVDWMVQLLKADQDRYWQEQKDQNAVIVPEGATHHFTKHFVRHVLNAKLLIHFLLDFIESTRILQIHFANSNFRNGNGLTQRFLQFQVFVLVGFERSSHSVSSSPKRKLDLLNSGLGHFFRDRFLILASQLLFLFTFQLEPCSSPQFIPNPFRFTGGVITVRFRRYHGTSVRFRRRKQFFIYRQTFCFRLGLHGSKQLGFGQIRLVVDNDTYFSLNGYFVIAVLSCVLFFFELGQLSVHGC
jgi:hypothetical protein